MQLMLPKEIIANCQGFSTVQTIGNGGQFASCAPNINLERYRVPTIEQCNRMRRDAQQSYPDQIMKRKVNSHVECVHAIGMEIGRELAGFQTIDLPLLDRVLRLHDICKFIEPHEINGERKLTEEGYPEVGELIRFHMLETFFLADQRYGLIPTILTYADMRSGYPTSTTLDDRERTLKGRYGVSADREAGLERLKEFEQMLGRLGINTDFTGIENRILIIKDLILLFGKPQLAEMIRNGYPKGFVEVKNGDSFETAARLLATYKYRTIGVIAAGSNEIENEQLIGLAGASQIRAIGLIESGTMQTEPEIVRINRKYLEREITNMRERSHFVALLKSFFGEGTNSDGIY
ncbi:MAG: HD domain-containing protein [Candidatus Micrarchaeia archaeon]